MRFNTQAFSVAFFAFTLTAVSAQAVTTSSHGFLITVQPVLGYEYFYQDAPAPRTSGMLIYGARFTAGRPHIAAEGEYTRGNISEGFTTPSVTTVHTTKENVSLGVRGTYDLGRALNAFLRLGGQASKLKIENIDFSGISTQSDSDWSIHPYLGAGVTLAPASLVSANLQATYVFHSLKNFSRNSVQLTAGISFNFNTR